MVHMKNRQIVGLVEPVKIIGKKTVSVLALCDSGAQRTSVDVKVAAKAELGPVIKIAYVRNPSLKRQVTRPVVVAEIKIKGKTFNSEVNLQDRSHMTFPMIIGRNILSGNFVVDAKKNQELFKKFRKEKSNESKSLQRLLFDYDSEVKK